MSFTENLKHNQMQFAENALLKTVFQDPNQTLGDIWEALEEDPETEVLFELFKKMSVGQLVVAGATFADAEQRRKAAAETAAAPAPVATSPKPDEDEDEFDDSDDVEFDEEEGEDEDDEDDDEDEGEGDDDEDEDEGDEEDEEDEGDEEDEDEEDEPEKKPRSKKKKPPKPTKKKKKGDDAADLSAPEAKKTYQGSIIKCLKQNKARNKKKAMSAQDIRKLVGGDPKQLRDNLNELIEGGRVAFDGKARGTKYYLE